MVNGSPATPTLTIATTMRTAMNSSNRPFDPLMPGGVLLAGISVPLVFRRRRMLARLSRFRLMALLLTGASGMLQGCRGGGGAGGTPPGGLHGRDHGRRRIGDAYRRIRLP